MEHEIIAIIDEGLAKRTVVNEYGYILSTCVIIGKQNIKLLKARLLK